MLEEELKSIKNIVDNCLLELTGNPYKDDDFFYYLENLVNREKNNKENILSIFEILLEFANIIPRYLPRVEEIKDKEVFISKSNIFNFLEKFVNPINTFDLDLLENAYITAACSKDDKPINRRLSSLSSALENLAHANADDLSDDLISEIREVNKKIKRRSN